MYICVASGLIPRLSIAHHTVVGVVADPEGDAACRMAVEGTQVVAGL